VQAGGRLIAAEEVLREVLDRDRPASLALADWGRSHRFAGSGDRAAIGNLVYDCLRKRASLSWVMGSDTPRALVMAAMHRQWHTSMPTLHSLYSGEQHSPSPMTADEIAALEHAKLAGAPDWVRGDYPEWLHPSLSAAFGDRAADEGAALSERASVDLRVNTLKATPDKVLKAFAQHGAVPGRFAPGSIRIPPREGPGRTPNVEADPAHGKGWFEVQDEGSQIAALLAAPKPRQQVADICAGAGGKTLAFAAAMQNSGQIYAYDADATRFRPIFERLKRAGARNVQTLQPGDTSALSALAGRMHLVLVDAPCSGSGTWRRKPDSKWRLKPGQLEQRRATQAQLVDEAALLVRPGGRLEYVTCSVFPEENEDQIAAFLTRHLEFRAQPLAEMTGAQNLLEPLPQAGIASVGYRMTPRLTATDGFYVAVLTRHQS
jgi:16S rRNA (cytosine967-C5)-methyltransferase